MTNYRHIQRTVLSIAVALMLNRTMLAQSPSVQPEVRLETRVRAPHPHPHPPVHVNDWENSELTVNEQETTNKSYTIPVSGERRHFTDEHVWGNVHVTGRT